jgi:hypothetical protein
MPSGETAKSGKRTNLDVKQDMPRFTDGTFMPGVDHAKGVRFQYSPEEIADIKRRFLDAYSVCDSINKAVKEVGVTRRTLMTWRKADNDFNEEIIAAHENSTDDVEQTLKEIGMDPDLHPGARVTALLGYLNANRPDLYRGTRGAGGGDDKSAPVTLHLHFGKRDAPALPESTGDVITVEAVPTDGE